MPVQAQAQDIFELLKAAAPARSSALQRMDLVAKLLDAAFVLPGTGRKIGIDAIIGLLPVVGDVFDAFFQVNQRNMRIVHAHLRRTAC